jgi:hypothetical protein
MLLTGDVPPLVKDIPFSSWLPGIDSIGGISVPGMAGIVVSIFLGLRLWRAINKSGHLYRRQP